MIYSESRITIMLKICGYELPYNVPFLNTFYVWY